jgi:hypothetical protein
LANVRKNKGANEGGQTGSLFFFILKRSGRKVKPKAKNKGGNKKGRPWRMAGGSPARIFFFPFLSSRGKIFSKPI